jgi:hypothetical protein
MGYPRPLDGFSGDQCDSVSAHDRARAALAEVARAPGAHVVTPARIITRCKDIARVLTR